MEGVVFMYRFSTKVLHSEVYVLQKGLLDQNIFIFQASKTVIR